VKEKEYLYRILNTRVADPFEHGRSWFLPREIKDDGLLLMQKAAKHFVGKYDFSAFMAAGSSVKSTEREVMYARVERRGDLIVFSVAADGFLYNMVRIMAGTLLDVAHGRIDPTEIPSIIASCDRARAGFTAPPQGLYLNRVVY
jgi:tRNA pseudouridine38-40 synthase